jgi:hypothetical protein
MALLLRLGAIGQDVEQGTGNTALFYAVMTDNQTGVKYVRTLYGHRHLPCVVGT